MKLDRIGLIVGIVAGVVAIWYYLRGTPQANLVTYPNTQASGQPASQNVATTYNIAAPSPMPSPNLIYGQAPPLPPTPAYQNYNYSPYNTLGLTPQGALTAQGKQPKSDCCGSDSCGCGSCASGGTYQDGNLQACLVANPAEQVRAGTASMYAAIQSNINSSAVGQLQPEISPAASPVKAAAEIPAQARGIVQGQVKQPIQNTPPILASSLLTWAQYGILTAINSGVTDGH